MMTTLNELSLFKGVLGTECELQALDRRASDHY